MRLGGLTQTFAKQHRSVAPSHIYIGGVLGENDNSKREKGIMFSFLIIKIYGGCIFPVRIIFFLRKRMTNKHKKSTNKHTKSTNMK